MARISSTSTAAGRLSSQICVVGTHFFDREALRVLEVAEMRPESRILGLAGRQHGVVTFAQLVAAGWSRSMIRQRVRTGWLRRLHQGVYLLGPLQSPHARMMAAVLATAPGALISHYPAAVLWDWRPRREEAIHVTLPTGSHNRRGITVHRATLHPADVTRRHGIPVTSAARTILDLAATGDELDRALNEAMLQRRVSVHSLNEQFSRYPRHKGTAALTKLLESEPTLTRSDAEILARDLIRKAGLPQPESNIRIEGHEVDLLWREQNLIVEIDSWAFHSMRSSFEQDRRRDQRLTTAGWRVIRITARQLTYEPERVVAILATALAA